MWATGRSLLWQNSGIVSWKGRKVGPGPGCGRTCHKGILWSRYSKPPNIPTLKACCSFFEKHSQGCSSCPYERAHMAVLTHNPLTVDFCMIFAYKSGASPVDYDSWWGDWTLFTIDDLIWLDRIVEKLAWKHNVLPSDPFQGAWLVSLIRSWEYRYHMKSQEFLGNVAVQMHSSYVNSFIMLWVFHSF